MMKEQYINQVTFTLSSKEKDYVQLLHAGLDLEGVSYKTVFRKNCIETIIQNWRNYLICWQIGLFDRCERKKKKFLWIANNSKVYGVLSQNELDMLWNRFTQGELAGIIGSWQGNVCKMLHGKILFSLGQIRMLEQQGIKLTITKLRIGNLTELPYCEETMRLFLTV